MKLLTSKMADAILEVKQGEETEEPVSEQDQLEAEVAEEAASKE